MCSKPIILSTDGVRTTYIFNEADCGKTISRLCG
jgi:hypothetical protein